MRGVLFLVVCFWAFGCAPRSVAVVPPAGPPGPDVGLADRLVSEGCYGCLQAAFRIYEAAGSRGRQFSTALLLALREKEVGLEAQPWIDRARGLATPDTSVYVDMVVALPWLAVGTAPDFEPPFPRPSDAVRQGWVAHVSREGAIDVLDRYLRLALTCEGPTVEPIVQYRLGICGIPQRPQLDAVFATSPRFVEAGLYIARYETTNSRGGRVQVTRALPLVTAAHEGIPTSPVITVMLADLFGARSEYARALALHDEALTMRPTQRDALLGRTAMLTYLGRPEEAIASATRMIDLGTWYLGEAYYWRAWNYYNTARLGLAASDVVEAKKFQSGSQLMTLSGMIAYDQQRPVDARRDFADALRSNPVNCPAMWYLGVLDLDETRWTSARDRFATSTDCYGAAVAGIQAEQLAPDLSPEARAQQEQDRARRLADNLRQEARSALNAALLSQQLEDREAASRFAQVAASHELTKERAENVLRSLPR